MHKHLSDSEMYFTEDKCQSQKSAYAVIQFKWYLQTVKTGNEE